MNILKSFLAIALIFTVFLVKAEKSPQEREAFIKKYSETAVYEMQRTNIPASITLAQAIFESGWGESELARSANNFFGIKCHNVWNGDCYQYIDDKKDENGKPVPSDFRVYNSVDESFIDHSEYLMTRGLYDELFKLSNEDYRNWAKGLKKCGYATRKDYAEALIILIEKYDLHKYDKKVEKISIKATDNSIRNNQNDKIKINHSQKKKSIKQELNYNSIISLPNRKDIIIDNEKEKIVFVKETQPKNRHAKLRIRSLHARHKSTITHRK